MKRILSLVLTFAMVFTTFGPSVYATGEGIADIINDDTAVLEQVEQTEETEQAEQPTEEITVDETTEEAVVEEIVTEEPVNENVAVSYKPVYLTGSFDNLTVHETDVFNSKQGSTVGIAFKDAEGNFVDANALYLTNSDDLPLGDYDKPEGTVNGNAVGFYNIEILGDATVGQYEFKFEVAGTPVSAFVYVGEQTQQPASSDIVMLTGAADNTVEFYYGSWEMGTGYALVAFPSENGWIPASQVSIENAEDLAEWGFTASNSQSVTVGENSVNYYRIFVPDDAESGTYNISFNVNDKIVNFRLVVENDNPVQSVNPAVYYSINGGEYKKFIYNTTSEDVTVDDVVTAKIVDENTEDIIRVESVIGKQTSPDVLYGEINADGTLDFKVTQVTEERTHGFDLVADSGQLTMYIEFNVVSAGGSEDDNDNDNPNNAFDGKVIWRYAGESGWNLISDGSNIGEVELELFSQAQFIFYNANEEKVLPTIEENLPNDFRVVFHEEDKIMNLTVESSRWDDSMEPIDISVEGLEYDLCLRMDYADPPIDTLVPFEGDAYAIIGEHNDPQYVTFDNFSPEAKWNVAFGVLFEDENGEIEPERVRPILGSKHGTIEINYGQDSGDDWYYEAWEIWFNQNFREHTYTVQFVIDETYLAEVEFTSTAPVLANYEVAYLTGPWDELDADYTDVFHSQQNSGVGIAFVAENGDRADIDTVELINGGYLPNIDYSKEHGTWNGEDIGFYRVEFTGDTPEGEYTLEFNVNGEYVTAKVYVHSNSGEESDPVVFWFSDTGNDDDWAYFDAERQVWLDIDRPFYIKITDREGNVLNRGDIGGFGGEGCIRYVPEDDDMWGIGEVVVNEDDYDACLADVDGDEYWHRHNLSFEVFGEEYSRELIVGHDPMYFWLNWDWDFYVDGPFSIDSMGTTDMGIVEYVSRPGWTADIEIGSYNNDGEYVKEPVQAGFEVIEEYAPGVPKTVRFDGEKIVENYSHTLSDRNGHFYIRISYYDEQGNFCGGTGCDVKVEFEFNGDVRIAKNGVDYVTYQGSEENPFKVKAGETFLLQFTDEEGNIICSEDRPLPVELIDQYEYDQMGISVWQNPNRMIAQIYSDVQGTYPLEFAIYLNDTEYTTTVWLEVEAPVAMTKAPSSNFTGQATVNGRYVENGSTVYITEDYMFLGAVDAGFDEYDEWYENDIEAAKISLAAIDTDVFSYTKSTPDSVGNAYRLICKNFEPGDETVVKMVVNGKLLTLNLVRDLDIEPGEMDIRPFTGKIFVIDSDGNREEFYSFLDENGQPSDKPYKYDGIEPLRIKSNAFIDFEFYDFRGELMTGPENVLEFHPDFAQHLWENDCYTEWNGKRLRLYVSNMSEGQTHTKLCQRYIQGNAHVDINLNLYKENIDIADYSELFNGKVYSDGKAVSFAEKDLIYLDRNGTANISFKEIINGAEVLVTSSNVKLATNFDSNMLYMTRDDDGVNITLNGLGGGESGIYVLDFIVNDKHCQVYVAYDLYCEYGDGSLWGIWEYAKEKDEDGNYVVKGISYWYGTGDDGTRILSLEAAEYAPTDGDGLVISKAFFDATFKNVKTKVQRLAICEGIKGIEGKAAKALTNLEELYTSDRGQGERKFAPLTLAEGEFAGLKKLNNISTLETNIGAEAFKGCTGLEWININDMVEKWHSDDPDSVENVPCYIGDNAFSGCTKLSQVWMDGNFVVGETPFKGCSKLTSFGHYDFGDFSISYSGSYREELRRDELGNEWKEHIQYIPANLLSGSSVKTAHLYDINVVESGAFKGCTALTKVSFNDRIQTIEDSAFSGCNNIKTVEYSKGLGQWYENVYVGKDNGTLNKLVVESDNVYVMDEGFIDAEGREDEYAVKYTVYSDRTMYIEGSGAIMDFELEQDIDHIYEDDNGDIHEVYRYYVDSSMHKWRYFVDEIYIMPGVTHIGNYAFYGFDRAYGVTLAQTGMVDTTIGEGAFAEMGGLCVFNMPMTVFYLADNTFENSGIYNGLEIRYAGEESALWNVESDNIDVVHTTYIVEDNIGGLETEEARVEFQDEFGNNGNDIVYLPGITVTVRAYKVTSYGDEFIPEFFMLGGKKLDARYVENDVNGDTYIEADFIVGNHYDEAEMYLHTRYNNSYIAGMEKSGEIGENITWEYDDGVLVISGTGALPDYEGHYVESEAPWFGLDICTLIIKEGITAIGDSNFQWMYLNKLVLPSTLKTIGNFNFYCLEAEELVFPANLTSIGTDCFNEISVNRIVFNNKLTTIGRESFQNMYVHTFGEVVGDEVVRNYLDITIPASVTFIGEGAFTGAGVEREYWDDYTGDYIGSFPSALRSITVDPANPYYKVENGALMTKDGKMFITLPAAAKVHYGQYIPAEQESWQDGECDGIYTVPYGVETMGFRALSGHPLITGVNLPETLKTINAKAFSTLKGLTHIVLPDSLEKIGDQAFEECCNLSAISMGKNLKEIGYDVFWCCENLTQIDVKAENENIKSENGFIIENGTLIAITKDVKGNIIIPSSVKTIAGFVFADRDDITGIQIPASVTNIDHDAFYACYGLRKIIVPDSVKTVGMWAFDAETESMLQIYYTGTEEQWNKLIGENPEEIFDNQEYVLEYWKPSIEINVDKRLTEDEYIPVAYVNDEAITDTADPVVLFVEHPSAMYSVTANIINTNPIFNDSDITATPVNVYSTNEDVVFVNRVVDEEGNVKADHYYVSVIGGGKADLVFESAVDPSVNYTVEYEVKQMSYRPEISVASDKITEYGSYIVIPRTDKKQTIKSSIVWDGEKWPKGTYHYEIDVTSGESIFEDQAVWNEETSSYEIVKGVPRPTVDANGTITIPKYTKAELARFEQFNETVIFELDLWLEDPTGEITDESFRSSKRFIIYPQSVKGIDVAVSMPVDEYGNFEDYLGEGANQAGKTIIMDAHAGDTVRYISVDATNWELAYNIFTFSASASDCFEVIPRGDGNAAMVKLLNGNSGSVKVTIKSVDGAKSTTVTFKTGTAVESLKVTSNAPFVGTEMDVDTPVDVYTIASGKSAKHTATVTPSNATTKGVKWYAEAFSPDDDMTEEEYAELAKLVTISSKGELKVNKAVPGGTRIVVWAETTDGTGIEDYVYYLVTEPAQGVYVGTAQNATVAGLAVKGHTVVVGEEDYNDGYVTGTLYAAPYVVTAEDADGNIKGIATNKVAPSVNWTVKKVKKNDISKYVTIVPNQIVGGEEEIAKVDFRVDGPRSGSFIICATAADGSGKKLEYTVTVVTEQYAIDMTAPKGVGVTGNKWVLTASSKGVTLKPTIEWNNGQSKPSDTKYEILLDGEVISTSYKFKNADAGTHSYIVRSVADPDDIKKTVVLEVVASSDIYLGSLDLMLPDTITCNEISEEHIAEVGADKEYVVAAGAKVELIQFFNGIKTTKTKAEKQWFVNGEEITGITSKTKPISTKDNKHYFTVPADAETIKLTCVYGNGVDNPISDSIIIRVVEKAEDIQFVKDGVQISAMKNYLNPDLGTVTFNVTTANENATCTDFTVTSSNAKLLKIEKTEDGEFEVTPLGVGKVNVTVKANDGSGASKVYKNVQIGKVESPVTSITTAAKSIYVDTDKAVAMTFALNATGKPATMNEKADMLWTSSNEDILTVDWTGANEDYITKSTTSKGKTTNYWASEGTLTLVPGFKTGKVTVTGKALDGSNKTVKLTVTVAANSDTETLDINVPAGTAIENNGYPILAWGKSIKLQPTFNKGAKNTTVKYTVEAVEPEYETNDMGEEVLTGFNKTGEDVSGITFSGSTIKAATASKKLQTPYSGWVKVTATLNHEVYVNGVENNPVEITDEQYIYVVKPVSKISVAQLTISKGKYKTKEVTSVKAKAGEELNFEQSPYVFAVNYKEYSTYTKDSATFGDISWTSSNTAIATVDQDGNVTISENAKNKSTVTIKAVAQDGTKVAKSIKITITK